MLVGRVDRDPPSLAALGRRWAVIARLPDGLSPRQAGVVSAAAVQPVKPVARMIPAWLATARPEAAAEQAVALPPPFKALATFRASLLMAERAVVRLDLHFAAAPEAKAPVDGAGATQERPADTERSANSSDDPAPGAALANAGLGDGVAVSYDARL
jgi:hypothetical protein